MNEMKSNDELNNYLAGPITVLPVDRRRPRNNGREVIYLDASVFHRARFQSDEKLIDVPV